ncbi:MAG: ABC transporter permease, partial [Actinomycetia bacterium]|nr:ABC transporter permease [Actinomycetes bacterium]
MVTPPSTDNHRSARSGRSTTSSRRRPLLRSSLRLIWNTFPRFISILLITVIGVAFFSGLRMTGDYLRANADVYLNSTNTMDINIVSTMGFSREDVQAIRATPGVESLYAGYSANLLVQVGDSLELSSQVLSLDPHSPALNQPDLQSGRLPAAVDECLVEAAFLRDSGKQLGDLVQFKSGDSTPLGDTLARDTYTIVGVVDSPLFLAKDRGSSDIGGGTNSYFFLLPATDFTQSVYTQIYVRVGAVAADDSRFTSAYSQAVNTVITALSSTGDRRSPLRLAEVRQSQQAELDTAQSEVDAGYQELQDAADQLADSRQRLDDGWQQLADSLPAIQSAEQQLATSRSSLNAGWSELAASRRQLDAGWAELASARQTLDAGWAAANAGQDQLSAGRQQLDAAAVDLANQRSQLEAAWQAGLISPEEYAAANSQIAAGEALYDQNLSDWQANQAAWQQSVDQLQAGEATYNASRAQLQNGEASYQSGRNRLNNGEAAYQSGSTELRSAQDQYAAAEADLETGEQEYSDGLATYQAERDSNLPKLADAQQQIDDGIAALNSLEAPQWYVLGLTDNAGFRTFQNEAAQLDALAFIMPGFFFLIAALVSMTAMTRLVDSERGTIATFKALGYANSAIMWRYLFYALSATLLGSVIGVLLGYSILPPMIFDAFRTLFNIPHSVQPFSPGYALLSSLVAVVAAVVPALLIVWGTVRENPAQAMRPLAPKIGRRILLERFRPLWRRLSFLQKITARNLFRYKKRLLMTIFGVAGCTALIFTALGLHDALGTLTAKQFGQVFMSDVTIDFKLPEDESLSDLTTQLDNAGVIRSYQPIYQRSMRISSPTLTKDITLVVAFQPEDLGQYIKLSPRQTGL